MANIEVRQFSSQAEAQKVAKELSKRPDVAAVVVRRSGRIEIHYEKPVVYHPGGVAGKKRKTYYYFPSKHVYVEKEAYESIKKAEETPPEATVQQIQKLPPQERERVIKVLTSPAKEGTAQYIRTARGYAKFVYRGGKWVYVPPGATVPTHEVRFERRVLTQSTNLTNAHAGRPNQIYPPQNAPTRSISGVVPGAVAASSPAKYPQLEIRLMVAYLLKQVL